MISTTNIGAVYQLGFQGLDAKDGTGKSVVSGDLISDDHDSQCLNQLGFQGRDAKDRTGKSVVSSDLVSDDHDSQCRGISRRERKNKVGVVTHVDYEPRLKRDNQSLWLGYFNTEDEAKLVREIAIFFYGTDESGWLDLEEGCFCAVQPNPDQAGRRYYLIRQLTERKEGKEKAKLVRGAAKQVHEEFKKKQKEHFEEYWLVPRRVGVLNAEGHSNVHPDARPLDSMKTLLQQPYSQDEIMRDNRGMTSIISSGPCDTSYPTPFNAATNPSVFSDGHEVLERSMEGGPCDTSCPTPSNAATDPSVFSHGHQVLERSVGGVPALSNEDALREDLSGSHAVGYELGQTVAQVPLSNCTPATSEPSFTTGSPIEGLLLHLVTTLHKENQELKRKNWELETQLLESQQAKHHRPSK